MAPGQFLLDPDPAQAAELAAPGLVVHELGQGRRVVVDVVGPHVDGRRLPTDTRVSRRSKASTGSSNAMYSIVLFIVDTSLSGFLGSGDRPTSAVDMTRATSSSGTRPVNST